MRFYSLLFLGFAATCFAADDDAYANGDDNANNGDDDGNDGYDNGDDNSGYDDDYSDDFFSNIQVCTDSYITVTGIQLLCDSPGTFYYGSGAYRNSKTCQENDKGKVTIYFDIEEDIETDAFATLAVSGGGEEFEVISEQDLCGLKSKGMLKSTKYRTKCPGYGSYKLTTSFYWNMTEYGVTYDDDGNSHFAPTLSVGFASYEGADEYDLGGANVQKCGNLNTVSNFINKHRGNAAMTVIWSFFILVATMAIIGSFAFFLWRKPGQANHDRTGQSYSGSFEDEYVSVEEQTVLRKTLSKGGLIRF
jgi:hypothetical protein|mmetsp:Transcript_16759/g.22014  ORF Transcript_16759/g.22014 Transcript_16759/m.22014 type:complete len:305 (-) Transcript_16759:163-1077(-)